LEKLDDFEYDEHRPDVAYVYDDPKLRAHLQGLSNAPLLPQSHVAYLYGLKAAGFNPMVVYDIGSCVLYWTKVVRQIWPNATVILFDAFDSAEFLYKEGGYQYHLGVLSNKAGVRKKFYENKQFPGGNSYYREIAHDSRFFPKDQYVMKSTSTLNAVVEQRGFPLPDLVKIDTQGSELDIIKGGMDVLSHASQLIVEMQHEQYNEGAPLAHKTLKYITKYFDLVAPKFSDNGPDADYGFSSNSRDI
jgi:FkbM family methyltransferase